MTPRGQRVRVRVARTFRSRLIGLLSRTALDADEGLLLVPGGSIHTIGMRFAIDVVFLSARFEVLKIASHIGPQRWVFAPRRTASVLELGAGMAARYGVIEHAPLSLIANTSAAVQHSA